MSNTELIKELRALTQAGMKDCKNALDESGWDLQKAVDIIKTKGLEIAGSRNGKVAAEGRVTVCSDPDHAVCAMMEVNCQTDFVANSPDFVCFSLKATETFLNSVLNNKSFDANEVESSRQALVSTTKENVVVRRWWSEEVQSPKVKVFSYTHTNNKLGILLTLAAPSVELANTPEFRSLGEDLALQVCAMNPLAVSIDRLSADDTARQQAIFEAQLKELNKPQASWPKIMEGKFRKWHSEVCLLEQESISLAKTQVKQVIKNVEAKLGGEITVVNFIRCQVGEGIVKKQDNLAEEVAKMM